MLEPELEEALKNATDAEMCDIAGEAPSAFGPSEAAANHILSGLQQTGQTRLHEDLRAPWVTQTLVGL